MKLIAENEQQTNMLASDFAMALRRGDLVELKGELGAGKTTFARAIIRALADDDSLEVPSPTFTLIQRYDQLTPKIIHADLYRLSSADEMEELGLDDERDESVILVEWPQKAGALLASADLTVEFSLSSRKGNDGRLLEISGREDALRRVERSFEIGAFLRRQIPQALSRKFLAGDASPRRYELITTLSRKAVLMDAARNEITGDAGDDYSKKAHLAGDIRPFIAIARLLLAQGFAPPRIFAYDFDRQLLLLEYLGSETIFTVDRQPIVERYQAAVELLAQFQQIFWPKTVAWPELSYTFQTYDEQTYKSELSLLYDWYLPFIGRQHSAAHFTQFQTAWHPYLQLAEKAEHTLVMRDYHSPNIIWRNRTTSKEQIGLLDFQDALLGATAYDVVSLTQDARILIDKTLECRLLDAYCQQRRSLTRPFSEDEFLLNYAILGAQRASKILGIFVRLHQRDGKSEYLSLLPTLLDYLERNLRHPQLQPLYELYCELGLFGQP